MSNPPITIDVRRHAWRGEPINESYCLTCGECVARCPRGVLHFEPIPLFTPPARGEPPREAAQDPPESEAPR